MDGFIKLIENFSLSEVIFVICTLIGLILSVEKVVKWTLAKFNWFHNKKNQAKDLQEIITKMNEQNVEQNKRMDEISSKLDSLTNATKQNMKHTITSACEEYLSRSYITPYELQSLEDIYKAYEQIGGNSFIHTLISKTRKLKVINNHDE